MRNSGKTLARCLNSVKGLVNEIILVDTGSVDNSLDIAHLYGAKIVKDPWQDDFARPRNIGLKLATCQWILIMDPDETISREDHIRLKQLTQQQHYNAFLLTTFNYSGVSRNSKYVHLKGKLCPLGKFPGYTPSTKTRFFRNGLGIRFEGCWHELVDWYILRNKLGLARSPIPIHHWSHEIEQASWKEKKAFYLKMGEKKVKEWPTSGKAHWELSRPELSFGYYERGKNSIERAIKYGFAGSEQFFALAQTYRLLNNKKKADFIFEKATCKLFPNLTHIDPTKKPLETIF